MRDGGDQNQAAKGWIELWAVHRNMYGIIEDTTQLFEHAYEKKMETGAYREKFVAHDVVLIWFVMEMRQRALLEAHGGQFTSQSCKVLSSLHLLLLAKD